MKFIWYRRDNLPNMRRHISQRETSLVLYKKQSCNHTAIPYLEQVQTLFRTVSHGLYTLFRAEAKN